MEVRTGRCRRCVHWALKFTTVVPPQRDVDTQRWSSTLSGSADGRYSLRTLQLSLHTSLLPTCRRELNGARRWRRTFNVHVNWGSLSPVCIAPYMGRMGTLARIRIGHDQRKFTFPKSTNRKYVLSDSSVSYQ